MDITIDHADLVETPTGQREWLLGLIVEADGESKRILHVLPEETLENMIVEYDLDPGDVDGALELALYLPWVEDPVTVDHPKAPHLTDAADARGHIVEQVRRRRGKGRLRGLAGRSDVGAAGPGMASMVVADSGAEDPLVVLRQEIPISEPHLRVKRAAYRRTRERLQQERSGARPGSAQPGAAKGRVRATETAGRARRPRETAEELQARLIAEGVIEPGEVEMDGTEHSDG